jgi:hypothetical protein
MRDNLRQARAIREALRQGEPGAPHGRCARPLGPLAALRRGRGASQSTPLPPSAAPGPARATPERRGPRCARGVAHAHLPAEGSGVPSAARRLAPLAWQPRGRVIDGSVGGRGGVALLSHVGSQGRARPLAWGVRRGQTGHGPAARPSALRGPVQERLPPGARGVGLGDGACAGIARQRPRPEAGWLSGWRPGRHGPAAGEGAPVRLAPVGGGHQAGPRGRVASGGRDA